ncbi:MAG: porin, partial [Gammaproteobacteria bacterium]|nr:porin [Gammaproteobacteria bacterium]
MAASGAAFAEATIYGLLNLSIDSPDTGGNTDSLTMKSQTSAIGLKGSEDLGDGMKAFYKVEFQVDPSERNANGALTDRDQYIGLKGGMGTVKFGTASSNYKQKGGSVDPMYRTSLEGRGALAMQSGLHGGAGRFGGRMTDMLQYSSPKMGGMQLVINTTFDDAETAGNSVAGVGIDIDETMGVGFRYQAKAFSVYVDMIDVAFDTTQGTDATDSQGSESATKIGGTFKAGPVKIGLQLEQTEDLMGSDYTMVSANYSIDKNNAVYVSFGSMSDDITTAGADDGSSSMALMYNHKMSKKTNVYVGYGDRSDDLAGANGYSVMTAGMRVKF